MDPIAKTTTPFNSAIADGLSLSGDGLTLYAAVGGHILGFDTTTKAQVFDSGLITGLDGTALGTGPLAGKIYGNTNNGELWEVDLATSNQTLIASGGSRGDLVAVDPNNATLLLTQTDRILRVSPEGRFGYFTFALTPVVATNTVGQMHTVTVTVTTNNTPAANILVTNVVTGANTSIGTCVTDTNGTCSFSYTGVAAGDDSITSRAFLVGLDRTATARKTWIPPEIHDLAVVKLKAPKKIALSATTTSKVGKFSVSIQNRGTLTETIPTVEALQELVSVEVETLGTNCASFAATLVTPKASFPINLAANKKLTLSYTATFNCANDTAATTKTAAHNDYKTKVTINLGAIGEADTTPSNDTCPRPPSGSDPGCGNKTTSKMLGADVLTDVVVK